MRRRGAKQVLVRFGRRERVERRERHAGRRGGKPEERVPRAPHLCDVEARQPKRGGHRVEIAEDPHGLPGAGEVELIDEEGGRDPEAHDVDQAVELGPEPGPGLRESGDAAVQRVQDPGEEDVPAGPVELAARREHHGPDAEEQVEQREQAGHDDHHAPHRGPGEAPPPTYSTSTLAPAWTRSPTFTRTPGRPAGPPPPPPPPARAHTV